MVYLTNDLYDQAVYFELRNREPRRKAGGVEHRFFGLLGNGINEVPVRMMSWRDNVEVDFGERGALFNVVDERSIRRLLSELARDLAVV